MRVNKIVRLKRSRNYRRPEAYSRRKDYKLRLFFSCSSNNSLSFFFFFHFQLHSFVFFLYANLSFHSLWSSLERQLQPVTSYDSIFSRKKFLELDLLEASKTNPYVQFSITWTKWDESSNLPWTIYAVQKSKNDKTKLTDLWLNVSLPFLARLKAAFCRVLQL